MQAFFSNKINKILSEENFKKIFKIEVLLLEITIW